MAFDDKDNLRLLHDALEKNDTSEVAHLLHMRCWWLAHQADRRGWKKNAEAYRSQSEAFKLLSKTKTAKQNSALNQKT